MHKRKANIGSLGESALEEWVASRRGVFSLATCLDDITTVLLLYKLCSLSTLLKKTSSVNFVKRKTNHGITNVHFWFPSGRQLFIKNNNHKTNQRRFV